MLEDVIYKNHLNEVVKLNGESGIFCNSNDLRDFSYSITKKNDRISSFSKGVVKKSLPIVIVCNSEAKGITAKNKLFEVMEKDVLANTHGQFIIGDYYLKCFVTGSKKSNYYYHKNYMETKLTIQTDLPSWVKESITTFGYVGAGGASSGNMDFNNDFPMDYTSNLVGRSVNNTGFVSSNFRITLYGAASNPSITIGGHEYGVAATMESNEYITIDSINKTVILTHTDGTTENVFKNRNKESYIFEKIPVGLNLVVLEGCQKADITLLEERSEPKWT